MSAIRNKRLDVVVGLDESGERAGAPVEIVFNNSPAAFYLERDHPCFEGWLQLLRRSHDVTKHQDERRKLAYTQGRNAAGLSITSLELAEELIGIVQSIDDLPGPLVFTIPDYAEVFFIPRDHPKFDVWLGILRKSQAGGIEVILTYTVGYDVTSLAFAQK